MDVTVPDAQPTDAAEIGRGDDVQAPGRNRRQLSIRRKRWLWLDWIAGLFLFLATAAVVVWQNSRLVVLWDLSYVLENAYRITLGQVPYRDFPFVHAPLTFLIQAGIIKLTGRVVWHHIAYCAVVGGIATVLTWRILLQVLRDAVAHARLLALMLSAPLIVLGVYCILPHPFYDPDCTLTILISMFLLQELERKNFPPLRTLSVGAMLVVPLFVKQNTGMAFLFSAGAAFVALILVAKWRRELLRGYVVVLAGAVLGLACALLLGYFTAGLRNYWHWTISFAAARRTPARADMLEIYQDQKLILWLVIFAAGAILFWFNRRGKRALAILSSLLMSAPFVWPAIYLLRDHDPSERADRLLAVWPVLLIIAFVIAIGSFKRRRGLSLVLPFILLATIHGAFLSQQVWGSTYGIWPLFMILLACTIAGLNSRAKPSSPWLTMPLATIISASLLISGGFYTWSNARLEYSNLTDGGLVRATLPQLKGLATRGDWIPDFEELVRYSEANIPHDDGLLVIPGEDLFYYTTGRRPQFPIVFFDHTTNPYSPEEIVQLCRERNIRWVIVKQELQLEEDPVENRDRLIELLEKDYEEVENLGNYDIYRRDGASREQDQDEDK